LWPVNPEDSISLFIPEIKERRGMSAQRTAPLLALLAIAGVVLFYGPRPAASQVGVGISQQERDTANAILATDAARYLSGDGLHALLMLSGKGPNTAFGLSGSNLPTSIDEDEAASVLVNNPAEDTLAIDDISSQSETAVAGFGSTIVVTFNDSFGFVFPNHSGMGFSRSTDGGATFTDLGNLPVPSTGNNEGDPGLVVDRSGNLYASSISFDSALPASFPTHSWNR
jgi:hypothetical protein